MINPVLRHIAITLLVMQTALGLFLYFMFTSEFMSGLYGENARFLHFLELGLYIALGGLFAYYCYLKGYFVVYYGLLSIFIVFVIASFRPNLSIILLITGHSLAIVHGVTILMTKARENLWLRAYAIIFIAIHAIRVAPDVSNLIQVVLPLLFVVMLLKEKKEEKIPDERILDER